MGRDTSERGRENRIDAPAVALIGAGAVGLPLAAALARAGCRIVVCGGRDVLETIEVTEAGATGVWPVSHARMPADVPRVDDVIVAVKAHQTAAIAPWLRACARDGVRVLVAQNGVEHDERVAPFIGNADVIPSVLFFNNERTGPGKAIVRRDTDGYIAMPDTEASRVLAGKFIAGGLRVAIVPNLATVAWSKLLVNIAANPLTALTGRRTEVIGDPAIAAIARAAMLEASRVAVAEGAGLTEEDVEQAMRWLRNVPEGSTTSMREDRVAGRPLECDALTGAVVRAAARHGMDVPVIGMLHALIAAVRPESAA